MPVLQKVAANAWRDIAGEVATPLSPTDRLLVVSAHPDDETIGAGRLIAGHRGPVKAVTLTAGERCLPDPGVDVDDMRWRRLAEWRSAVGMLGAEPLEAQRWPDGRLAEGVDEVVLLLADLLAEFDVVASLWRHDPHPDHQAAGRAAAKAASATGVRMLEFPVWAPYWTSPTELVDLGYAVDVVACTPLDDQRRQLALQEYASQIQPHLPGWEPVVPAEMLERHGRQLLMSARP